LYQLTKLFGLVVAEEKTFNVSANQKQELPMAAMFFVQSRRHEKYLYSILQKFLMAASYLLDQDEMKIHCRRPHKTSFLQILVPIGLVDSKEMIYIRAHVGGRFHRRSRLVAAHFALY
jgi:hypothetical protein